MRAVGLRNGGLTVRETPDPEPGPGELLLKTLSTAICTSDVHFMDHPELAIADPTRRSLYDPAEQAPVDVRRELRTQRNPWVPVSSSNASVLPGCCSGSWSRPTWRPGSIHC